MQDTNNTKDGLSLEAFTEILREVELQPAWRAVADKEMDYADGNQLDGELVQRQKALGIPPAIENLIGPALLSVQGFEAKTRTDWRVSADGEEDGQDVADALNHKLNQAERNSKADHACSDAFRSQIGAGVGWVEVSRESDPFKYPYRCGMVRRNEIHWDMKAVEPDLSDARFLVRKRWMPPQRAALAFPEHKELIEQSSGRWVGFFETIQQDGEASTGLSKAWDDERGWSVEEQMWYDQESKHVCLFEVWYRVWSEVLVLKSKNGRVVEYDKKNHAHNLAVAMGQVTPVKAIVSKIRRSYWMGPHKLSDDPSPYQHKHFPYVPFWCFKEDRTGVPFGFTRGMMYQQDAVNSGTSKMRWGMSSVRTERTAGAVAMSDEQFRQMIARVDADIILDPQHMAQTGATFKVHRDFQLNEQHYKMLGDARAAIERVSSITSSFSGREGNATSGRQEDTQVEQSNQTLASVMDSFKRARAMMGEMLLSFIIEDIGNEPTSVLIEGDAVNEPRTIMLNQPQQDGELGYEYLTNDVQRTRLKVALEDVPSTTSYRGQQLNAMSEAVKSLPPQYQAAVLPFMVGLMDVPNKKEVVQAIRDVSAQETPEAIQQRIEQGIQDGVVKAGHDLKARELELKYSPDRLQAEVEKLVSEALKNNVQSSFASMQAGAQIAQMPQIAPIADAVMVASGRREPMPGGVDPNFPTPQITAPVEQVPAVRENTSPEFPPVPQQADSSMQGIETARTTDNMVQ